MRVVNEGLESLRVHFIDPETSATISTWSFHEPIVHAIDFGAAAHIRPEPAEISVEFEYTAFDIDGYTI